MGLLAREGSSAPEPTGVLAGLVLAAAGIGCATGSTAPPPLRPAPIAYADTLPIEPPAPRLPNQVEQLAKAAVGGEIGRAFSMHRWWDVEQEALNVTPFDGVVSSAWFEGRNGRERLAPEAVARGPTGRGPDVAAGLTVIAGKSQGISPGFTVRDAEGDVYRIKFDPRGHLHLASAAGVISNRLFWAAGYHTPEDYIVRFDADRLRLDPEAEVVDDRGFERRMTEDDVYGILALTDTLPDGRYLAIASRELPGTALGPFLFHGVRPDDPNDHYHHEYRRELRGLYVLSAWLNHVDMRYENSLDVFISPPGFVRHYLIDFAATLGSGTVRPHSPREGSEYNFDLWPTLTRVFSLGFYTGGWEDASFQPIHPSIGWMPVEGFDPATWKPNWPNAAFGLLTARDGYWGAKLVGSFTDEQLEAAVAEGQLPTRVAADTLVDILALRRDRTVEYWYGRVTPLENPTATRTGAPGPPERLEVAFDDLGLEARIWTPAETRYAYELEHAARGIELRGEVEATAASRRGPPWRSVLRLELEPEAGVGHRALTEAERIATLRISARRPGADGRPSVVYLRYEDETRGYDVVGLEH